MAEKMFARTKEIPRSLQRKDRLSVTELECYRECPRLYELKYVHEIPEEALRGVAPSVIARQVLSPAERGSAAHGVFELWSLEAEDDIRQLIRHVLDERRIADARARTELERDIVNMCERFKADDLFARMRASTDMRSEMRFSINVDGAVIEGIIDRTFRLSDGTRCLLDFKTDKVEADQAQERAQKYSFQLGIYSLAVSQLEGGSVPRASVYFLTPSVEVELPIERDSLEQVNREASDHVARIRSSQFPAKRDQCHVCPYERLCGTDGQPY
jgi:ATP-dependent exoDNAse (exonuclease V) beta subunit